MSVMLISDAKAMRTVNRSSQTRTIVLVRNTRGEIIALPSLLYLMSVRTQRAWHARNNVPWTGRLPLPTRQKRRQRLKALPCAA
jgi:hypothetical protein